jgi:hypothetical protein
MSLFSMVVLALVFRLQLLVSPGPAAARPGSSSRQAIGVVLGVVLSREEHQQAAFDGLLDALDDGRDATQSEQGADAQERDHGVRPGFSSDARLQLGVEVRDELGQLARLVAGQVFWSFEVGVAVLMRCHPFGEGIGQVQQQPALACLLGGQSELVSVGTKAELICLVVHRKDDALDGREPGLPWHCEVLAVGSYQFGDLRRHGRPPVGFVLLQG